MANPNPPPLLISLLGGALGGVASTVIWWLLGVAFWMPAFDWLRSHHMNVDDNGWAAATIVTPFYAGLLFFISTYVGLRLVERGKSKLSARGLLVLANLMPGAVIAAFKVYGLLRGTGWDYPGFGLAILLLGSAWGLLLYRMVLRRSGAFNPV